MLEPIVRTVDSSRLHNELNRLVEASRNEDDALVGSEPGSRGRAFHVQGYCIPCDKPARFLVDYRAGGSVDAGPNWRELMICPRCHLSNRQRLIATLVQQAGLGRKKGLDQTVYVMEQTTPLYRWLVEKGVKVTGSEYFGHEYSPGENIGPGRYLAPITSSAPVRSLYHRFKLVFRMFQRGGFRHEDLSRLSFDSSTFDLIVSNDVFEHLPSPEDGFRECARVLKPGGEMLMTVPFQSNSTESVIRARLSNDTVTMLEPPIYHGNPISDQGSLVFTDFGWDILDSMTEAGFSSVELELYRSPEYGHRGPGLLIFRAVR